MKQFLEQVFICAAKSCHPQAVLPTLLPKSAPAGKTIVLGAGKAAAEMAAVVARQLGDTVEGCVVTRYGYGEAQDTGNIKLLKAAHPVPDENSLSAAEFMLAQAQAATADDRVIFLISGGGSALLALPAEGISLEEKRLITKKLVLSGAPIGEINLVRQHLSGIKGGNLALAAGPAEVMTFAISDVVGDDPKLIASGPTVFCPWEKDKVLDVFSRYSIEIPESVKSLLQGDTIRPSFDAPYTIAAKNSDALDCASERLREEDWSIIRLGDDLEGNACDVGADHGKAIKALCCKPGRYAFVSGGELTVSVKNTNGRGGPSLEYLAGFLLAFDSEFEFHAMACDSDGIDGSEDNAGGYVSHRTLAQAREAWVNIEDYLEQNNTYPCFEQLGALVVTGPTGTNVNDIRIILVDSRLP